MAYPSTPISFTTKSAGQTIAAAHVNDVQTEVAAIESGLLSGLAHNLIPDGNLTRSLGSTSARFVIDGSQLTAGTVPSSALASSVAGSSDLFYRGDGLWASPTAGSTFGNLNVSSNSTLTNLSAVNCTLTSLSVTSSVVTVNAATNFIRWGGADPSTGAGLAGGKGSIYISTATGEGFIKQTTTDTGWKLFTLA